MSSFDKSAMAVVVTYGDRAQMCRTVVVEALRQGVEGCVVVSNGCRDSVVEDLRDLARRNARVVLLEHETNLGSAAGFGRGMKVARKSRSTTFLWLLDDDNLPEDGALTSLQALAWETGGAGLPGVVFALREDSRVQNMALAKGSGAFPGPGSFLYFDVLQRLSRAVARHDVARSGPRLAVPVPYGPYGGMLLPAAVCDVVGYPDEELVLYEDDTEYTARLSAAGFPLTLTGVARIRDLQVNWLSHASRRAPGRLLSNSSPTKTYFSVRNRAHFDRSRAQERPMRLSINVAIYTGVLLLSCRSLGELRRLLLMLRAALDGLRGELGPRPQYPLG